ncbi:hypothetical protein WJU16_10040 [Chitinophaga pollutisoli]|uniref:Uncharacterized protein n=1 Tax=Chitinophaga pollutisoli TaxID=3133966 RepID=A0ABZ2YUE8_9BACT
MKRSILFLGACMLLGLGITTAIQASSQRFIKVCCDQNRGICQRINHEIVLYGPSAYQFDQCP